LDEIQTKVLIVLLLLFTVTSTALLRDFYFFKLTQSLTVCTVQLLYNVTREKGGKPDRKPYPLPHGLRNLKSENSQDYAQKSQQNCMFMNTASEGHERARIYKNTCTMEISYNGVHLV
jgi:hypothetical protein